MSLVINISAFFSTALAVYSIAQYIYSIFKGKTKPHQLSWLVYTIMSFIVFLSQFLEGARLSVLISMTFSIGCFIIFLLSLKLGVRKSSRWDRALFIFALGTIVVWYLTKNNVLAIWLAVLIDLSATIMIILKTRIQPYLEAPMPWIIGLVAYFFTTLTLIDKSFGVLYIWPIYGLMIDFSIVLSIYFYRWRLRTI